MRQNRVSSRVALGGAYISFSVHTDWILSRRYSLIQFWKVKV
jgi:hypothetical protein